MNTVALANMLGVVEPELKTEEVLNSIIEFKLQKLIIYASLTREQICAVHNLVPREKAALIHI